MYNILAKSIEVSLDGFLDFWFSWKVCGRIFGWFSWRHFWWSFWLVSMNRRWYLRSKVWRKLWANAWISYLQFTYSKSSNNTCRNVEASQQAVCAGSCVSVFLLVWFYEDSKFFDAFVALCVIDLFLVFDPVLRLPESCLFFRLWKCVSEKKMVTHICFRRCLVHIFFVVKDGLWIRAVNCEGCAFYFPRKTIGSPERIWWVCSN